ncbi:MAG: DUF1045 domain-containing protein [Pseudomonadota bacterium]
MKTSPRYAIYFAPSAETLLWKSGSEWLGRDAYSGSPVERREFPGTRDEDIDRLTSSASHYGFHATMKAPFVLKEGFTEDQLLKYLESFSLEQSSFEAKLSVRPLGQFLALRLLSGMEQMRKLHEDCVRKFDKFRAPLTMEDIERRRKANLSPDQDARMLEWGYPYIFDDFRWHMTLSNRILSDSTRDKMLEHVQAFFKDVIAKPILIDGVAVYRQVDLNAPFNIIGRAAFPALVDQPS